MTLTSRRIFKVLLGGIATIVLGAIGSGLWERALGPVFDSAYRAILDIVSRYSTEYTNVIYRRAATGFHEDWAFRTFAIFSAFLALTFNAAALFLLSRRAREFGRMDLKALWGPRAEWVALVLSMAIVLGLFLGVSRHEAVFRTTTYSIQSMEIVRPHTGEPVYLELRSQFFQIRTKNDFLVFKGGLERYAIESKVRLPEFEPY